MCWGGATEHNSRHDAWRIGCGEKILLSERVKNPKEEICSSPDVGSEVSSKVARVLISSTAVNEDPTA